MRILLIITTILFFCASCGVKDDPKYQSQINYSNKNKII